MRNSLSTNKTSPAPPPHQKLHRSGAVAHMLDMPVATLRVWERRYGLTQPELSPGGQRLYSAHDVHRLALVKQLTDLGHAIGSLAALELPQLQRVAAMHASAQATTRQGSGSLPARVWRLAVVGSPLSTRLQRPALLRRLGPGVMLLGPFDTAAQAGAALTGADLDALLFQEPHLHEGWLAAINAAAPALASVPKAVLYGFAADPVCEALATAGAVLLREPQPDVVVAQWLHSLSAAPTATLAPPSQVVPPRRWDDATLAHVIGLSSTVACECPRHVAELLLQLLHFEAYSAECERRSTADAHLHAHLRQTAAASRALFETALEQVALHEGLVLP
jgi:MerR family transcriptional regulator, light-induced transcriptional regulator